MAIVEDEMRNESEEENEIEVVVDEDDSDDAEDDDDDLLEQRVSELEVQIKADPYNYDAHIDLIQTLWSLSELERWRAAFERLQGLSLLKEEHWIMRLQIEKSLAHSDNSSDHMMKIFEDATLDCYSTKILSLWCTWAISSDMEHSDTARRAIQEVLSRAGSDPLSGKSFWDAKLEMEKAVLENMSESDAGYKEQKERILWCLEEIMSQPLLNSSEVAEPFQKLALELKNEEYVEKVKKQHAAAAEFFEKITPYEDNLLITDEPESKFQVYKEYIDQVKALSEDKKYSEIDCKGILKVLYDRATYECMQCENSFQLLLAYSRHAQQRSSRATYRRVLDVCTRRCPRRHTFWTLKMQQAEHEETDVEDQNEVDKVKSIFEQALSKGMESFKEAELLWLSYLESCRRHTAFDDETSVERLRRMFRLAWDTLAEEWGDVANDSEIPLYWARLEYKRMKDPKHGKEIFEEIFKYGENKTMSKYWEALVSLESSRVPTLSEHKLRDLYRRALKFVSDYPPAIVRLWTDYERDYGHLGTLRECTDLCEAKIKEWRDNYQAMRDKMTNQKHKPKPGAKWSKFEKNKSDGKNYKGKRKADDSPLVESKKKKEEEVKMNSEDIEKTSGGVKRSHEDGDKGEASKRIRTGDVQGDVSRDACTLFVSNLPFKVDEEQLRDKLSEYGDIVSLRVRVGVKAFGGSICYCQYTDARSVEEALKHDRTPLDGRPMFLSRYSASKTKQNFKYPTTSEKNKLFVRNLPFDKCNKEALTEIFDKYGKLNDIRIVTYKDGKPKGLAYIDYEDEASASSAIEKTNGLLVGDRNIDVAVSAPPPRAEPSDTASLGQPKRDGSGGMRRTQLSSFIPRVLQQPSSSKAASNGSHSNGDSKPTLSNNDFRNMLLKK